MIKAAAALLSLTVMSTIAFADASPIDFNGTYWATLNDRQQLDYLSGVVDAVNNEAGIYSLPLGYTNKTLGEYQAGVVKFYKDHPLCTKADIFVVLAPMADTPPFDYDDVLRIEKCNGSSS